MAKALGLIGNFKGKLGNTVGYSLKDSNNKQTQGVRVYQPVVRNPKTAAQAEQRAKLAPINATYRALKMVIDRGQEGVAYGNKSRLAWLSAAMKGFNGGWFEKGAAINMPALVPLTKGSLPILFTQTVNAPSPTIKLSSAPGTTPTTIGALSEILMAQFTGLKEQDQITFVAITPVNGNMITDVVSLLVDPSSTDALPHGINIIGTNVMMQIQDGESAANAVILSREGSNGTHLRSTTELTRGSAYSAAVLGDDAKQAAIKSYMSQGANTDWAEESLM